MVYVLIGIFAIFIIFAIWAIKEANDFKAKKKEKEPEPDKPKIPDEPTFEIPKEKKEKKVKIKKKEKPAKTKDDGSVVVPVFEDKQSPATSNNFDDVNDDLYKHYNVNENQNQNNSGGRNLDDFDIDKKIEEIRRTARPQPAQSSSGGQDKTYYSFSAGTGSHSGSLKDPNFNPWPDEKSTLYSEDILPSSSRGLNSLIDDDDDDLDILDRIMRGRNSGIPPMPPMPERTSRLGGGSVKSVLSGRNRAQDIVIGQTVANRKGTNKPDGDGDKK